MGEGIRITWVAMRAASRSAGSVGELMVRFVEGGGAADERASRNRLANARLLVGRTGAEAIAGFDEVSATGKLAAGCGFGATLVAINNLALSGEEIS